MGPEHPAGGGGGETKPNPAGGSGNPARAQARGAHLGRGAQDPTTLSSGSPPDPEFQVQGQETVYGGCLEQIQGSVCLTRTLRWETEPFAEPSGASVSPSERAF